MSPRDDLKAFVDGELSPERMAEMRETIDRDPALAREAAELAQIGEALRLAAAQPVATGLDATLRALGRAERRPLWPWVATLAAAAGALALIVPMLKPSSAEEAAGEMVAMNSAVDRSAPPLDQPASSFEAPAAADTYVESAKKPSGTQSGPRLRSQGPADASEPKANAKTEAAYARPSDRRRAATALRGSALSAQAQPQSAVPRAPKPSGIDRRETADEPQSIEPTRPAKAPSAQSVETIAQEPPLVVEVDSVEDAEAAVRELAFRLGGQVSRPEAKSKGSTDSIKADVVKEETKRPAEREAFELERRLVLEVDEDRVSEARKKVPEAIAQERLRRQAALSDVQNRGGFDTSQSAGQRQGPGQGVNQQRQGSGRGFGGGTSSSSVSEPERETKSGDPARRDIRSSKPKRRVEIVLKVRPKQAPGKLDE